MKTVDDKGGAGKIVPNSRLASAWQIQDSVLQIPRFPPPPQLLFSSSATDCILELENTLFVNCPSCTG